MQEKYFLTDTNGNQKTNNRSKNIFFKVILFQGFLLLEKDQLPTIFYLQNYTRRFIMHDVFDNGEEMVKEACSGIVDDTTVEKEKKIKPSDLKYKID